MSREFDIVIVGAGVVGTVAAALLVARRVTAGPRIAVVTERLPSGPPAGADWDLRVFALSRASERLLRLAGVWERLPPARLFAYERMCVWDASGTPRTQGSLSFDSAEIGEPNLGYIVESRALQMQCLQAARAQGVVVIEAGADAVTVGAADVRLRLTDGRELRSQLLLAADGVNSAVRGLLGIGTAGHSYHQDALVAHVRTARPHENTAWQRFLETGPLAFLPLPDGRSSIVWSTTRAEAARLAALDAGAFGEALSAASAEALGRCELTTPVEKFPLQLQYATDYVRPRAALLGDAAHVVHPLAGQGLNLGLLDCAVLAEVLGEAQGGGAAAFGDLRLLRRYERRRRSENLLAATAMDGLERLFSNRQPLLTGLRAAGLSAVGKLPIVKREFARRALGLAGDVPGFLRAP